MTLKQGQGRHANNDNVDHEQGYYNAKFKRSHFNGVQEKANVKEGALLIYLVNLTILQNFHIIKQEQKNFN